MSREKTALQLGRVLVGFCVAPLVATLVYTRVAFGVELFFPFVIFVLGAAFPVALLVFVPLYLLLLKKRWTSMVWITGIAFMTCFALFAILFYFNDQGFTSMKGGGHVYVEGGHLTVAGYWNIARGASLVAVSGSVGAFSLWLIAHANYSKAIDLISRRRA